MQVKFNKRLEDYDYIFAFDLAKHKSGMAFIDFKNKKILFSDTMETNPADEMPWVDFYVQLKARVDFIKKQYGSSFFVLKERLPYQAGPRSTIATLQGLAQAHAIFDFFVAKENLDYYDWDGIHSVSVKAYFKKLLKLDKPQKKDIYDYVKQIYPTWTSLEDDILPYDISDSIAVAETLINRKWNLDIDEKIKELRKQLKKIRMQKKVEALNKEIDKLIFLKKEET